MHFISNEDTANSLKVLHCTPGDEKDFAFLVKQLTWEDLILFLSQTLLHEFYLA